MTSTFQNPETIVLHTGYRNDPVTGAVAVRDLPDNIVPIQKH